MELVATQYPSATTPLYAGDGLALQKIVLLGGEPGLAAELGNYARPHPVAVLTCHDQSELLPLLETDPSVSLIVVDQAASPALEIVALLSQRPEFADLPILVLLDIEWLSEFRRQCRSFEHLDFLLKPLDPPILRQRLGSYLSMGRYSRELALLTDQQRLTVGVMDRILEKRKNSEIERDKFKRVLDAAQDTVLMFDSRTLFCVYANYGATHGFGYSHDEWMSMKLPQVQDEVDEAGMRGRLQPLMQSETSSHTFETEFISKSGKKIPVRMFVQYFKEPGSQDLFVCFVTDISEHVAQTAALEHQSLHDGLTGLPNRNLFQDRLVQAIAAARRSGQGVGVFMMDLNRFKEVNDTLGHHVGDVLLQQVGQTLGSVLRETDTIARLGGDEFAVLMANVGDLDSLTRIAEKIAVAVRGPFEVENHLLDVGISIGIVRFPNDGDSSSTLMRRADVAMYEAKRKRISYMVYEEDQDKDNLLLLTLESEFRHAIGAGQLELYYQPKIDVASKKLVGMEALVRWNHPEKGLVPPDAFIAMAERTGLITSLTQWVIEAAMRQCALWDEKGYRVKIAVNLSTRNLMDVELPAFVKRCLDHWQIEPWQLTFEVTESDIMGDSQRVLEVMTAVNAMGVNFSVDDFGTGYSSLSYLKKLPIQELKVDKSFISNMIVDGDDMVIAHSTIQMAHHLGLQVVAEGVENREIWELLSVLQCDVAQGYYFSRPLSAHGIEEWIRRGVFEPEDRSIESA